MGDVTEAKQNVVSNDILGFETNCKRFVVDPLYGPIALTETEFDVLQTRLFQRLRHIKQLARAALSRNWCKMVIILILGFGGNFDSYICF
jgi:hypothetical protein